jgi:hypothetical protein
MRLDIKYHHVSNKYALLNDYLIGKAGEYIACTDLILKGYNAFPIEHNLPYDIVLTIEEKIYKVQVKTTRDARLVSQRNCKTPAYGFGLRNKGYKRKGIYTEDQIDMYALVVIETREVAYYPFCNRVGNIHFRVPKYRGEYWDEKWIKVNHKINEFKQQGFSNKQIAEQLGLTIDALYAYYYTDNSTKGIYFDEFTLERCLAVVNSGKFKTQKILSYYKSLVEKPDVPNIENEVHKLFVIFNEERMPLVTACKRAAINYGSLLSLIERKGKSVQDAFDYVLKNGMAKKAKLVKVDGEEMPIRRACKKLNVSYNMILGRIKRMGMSFEDAILLPKMSSGQNLQKFNEMRKQKKII